MKNLKKLLAVVLAVAMMLTIMVPAFAAENYSAEANKLNSLGLYKGVSTDTFNPDLSSALDRQTGVTLLLRIFGLEADALALSDADVTAALAKFTDASDIADWAKKTVAYAVKNGLVVGTTETTFGAASPLNGKAYATLILRQLGYTVDEAGYAVALSTLVEKGGVTAAQAAAFDKDLIKDDVVGITFGTLNAVDSTGKKVIDNLIAEGVVTEAAAIAAGVKEAAAALSASITGAKKITVNFGKAVAEDTAIVIKKGTVAVNVDEVKFAEDKKSAVVTTTTKLSKGDYTITVGDASVTLTAADEKVADINILSETAPRIGDVNAAPTNDQAKRATVRYEVLNQYGERLTGKELNVTASTGVPVNGTGKVTNNTTNGVGTFEITAANSQDFVPGAVVYITSVYTADGVVDNDSVTIGLASKADSIEFKGVYDTNKSKLADLPAGFAANRYVLLYTVFDQYGNKISNPDDDTANGVENLSFTSNNPLFVSPTIDEYAVDATIEDSTYEAVLLAPGTSVANGGTVTIQAISTSTGKISTYTITAEAISIPKSFTMSAPSSIVAEDESVEIPFTAIDQYGNPVTEYEDFFDANGTSYLSLSPSYTEVTENSIVDKRGLALEAKDDGTAKLVYYAPSYGATKDTDYLTNLTSVVLSSGNSSNVMINVKEFAVPTSIVGIDSTKGVAVAANNSLTVKPEDLIIQDQYGRTIKDSKVNTFVGAGYTVSTSSSTIATYNYSVLATSKKPSPEPVGTTTPFATWLFTAGADAKEVQITGSGANDYVTISAKAGTVATPTEVVTFQLLNSDAAPVDANSDGIYDNLVVGSDKALTFTRYLHSSYASYEVKDPGLVYDSLGTNDPAYYKKIVVYGVLANGTKVELPNSDYSIEASDFDVVSDGTTDTLEDPKGFVAGDFEDAAGNTITATSDIIVTVLDAATSSALAILEKEVTVSKADPKIATIVTDTEGDYAVVDGSATINPLAANGNIGFQQILSYTYTVTDQYGVHVKYKNADQSASTDSLYPTAPTITISALEKKDGSSFAVTNNGKDNAAITGAKLGDKFTATIKYGTGASVTIKFTVGIPKATQTFDVIPS